MKTKLTFIGDKSKMRTHFLPFTTSIFLILFTMFTHKGFSQCVEANTNTNSITTLGSTSYDLSQSFVADCSGVLESIELPFFTADASFNVVVYKGEGTLGTQVGSTISGLSSMGSGFGNFETFDLTGGGITLVSGQTYTFNLESVENINFDQTNSVTDGVMYFNGNLLSDFDMIYKLNITTVNVLPTDIILSDNSINQTDTGVDTTVGTLTTTDADTADTHTYSLVSGTGDTNNGSFTISGNTLRTSSALTADTYSVRINTNDGTGDYAKAFSITVVNDMTQCIESNTNISAPDYSDSITSNVGQSFVADCSGALESIELQFLVADASFDVAIYEGAGTGGTQVGSTVSSLSSMGSGLGNFETFDLTSGGITLVSGETYTFNIESVEQVYYDGNASVTDGVTYFNGNSLSIFDMIYKLNITDITVDNDMTQCIESNTNVSDVVPPPPAVSFNLGQSFVADCSGTLESIELQFKVADASFNVVVYEGEGTLGTQVGSIVSGLSSMGSGLGNFEIFDLTSGGITLVSGQTYTFNIESVEEVYVDGSGGDNVTDGVMYVNGGSELELDMIYKLNITGTPTVYTWTGTNSNDWATATNWDLGTLPTATSDVIIPAGLTNYPVAGTAITVNTITLKDGASFIPLNTVTGTATYTRNLPNDNWYLISSPFTGATFADLVTDNDLAEGTGTNIGLSDYNNDGSGWMYMTPSILASIGDTDILNGKGFAIKLATAGAFSLTGTITTSNVTIDIIKETNGFNLIGNPYTAYINSADFFTKNTSALAEETIWLWNGTDYVTYNAVNSVEIAPMQGFFVDAASTSSTSVEFDFLNVQYQTTDTFLKQEPTPTFELFVNNGDAKTGTKVFYVDGKTTGFDNGYDSKMFGGVASDFAVFTELVSDNEGNKLAIQTLPKDDTSIIPVGVIAKAGEEITFSIESLNLDEGTEVYLEDKISGEFTNLSETTYKTIIEEATNGVGQFYIHTSAKSLSTDDIATVVNNVSIYKSSNQEITISGLNTNASVSVFSLLGKKVMNTNITSNGVSKISLPTVSAGVYIVKLNSEYGEITKKITLN